MRILTLILLTTLALQACKKDYLGVAPDNRTKINTLDKLSQLVGTAYPSYDYYTFTEAASDNTEDKGPGVGDVNDVIAAYYTWQDYPGRGTNTTTNYWNGCYEAIAAANHALEAIEVENFGNAALPYKGEALVARAYAHHMLAIFFATPYRAGTANDAPGIPYVTKPETELLAQYERGTVQSTYDNIEKDLLEGIKLISNSSYKVPKYHFTKEAAYAFAARFYLFKGDYAKAIEYANFILPVENIGASLRPIAGDYRAMGYEQYHIDFTRSNQKPTLLLANNYSTYQRIANTSRYGFGATTINQYTADGNVTKKTTAHFVLSYGAPHYTLYKFNEYFYYATASTGYPYIQSILLTMDETLMIRAEAYAESGQPELALKDLNTFYSVRISNYNPVANALTHEKIATYYGTTDQKEGLITAILDAKKLEFAQEGIRWMDIVRRGLTVKKNLIAPNGEEKEIELLPNDKRRLFQLPEEVSLAGVEKNPR